MRQSFQQSIALLDEGFGIYRRNVGSFFLIAFGWFVPTAIMIGGLTAASSWMNSLVELAIAVSIGILALPLTMYLIVGLSRVADDTIAGRVINLRAAVALHPLRAIGMSFFTIIFSILTQIVTGILVMVCICPIYVVGIFGIGLFSSVSSSSSGSMALGFAALGVFFGGAYLLVLVVGGAGYSSLVYALQPWALERLRFGEAIQRSLDLVGYRFRSNMLVWGLAAILLAAAGLSVAIVIGLLIPLPTIWLLGESSPIAQAVSASAWLAALVVVLPPLPIWMALLYRRNMLARSGADLAARIDAWEQSMVQSE
jgi:hypothetical protein